MRTPLLAGNWKMFKTPEEAKAFFQEFLPLVEKIEGKEILLCVPFIDLQVSIEAVKNSNIQVGAQNGHWEKEGAYTGEISMEMLKQIQCPWVIIGHSERREYFGETNQTTAFKVRAALENGLKPILCVGESLEERESGKTNEKVIGQITEGLAGLSEEEMKKVTVAYEPIWAIGTGKTATSEDAQNVCSVLRSTIQKLFGEVSQEVRILYGGSVKPDNAPELLAQPDIDGALVGGASLKAGDFAQIVKS